LQEALVVDFCSYLNVWPLSLVNSTASCPKNISQFVIFGCLILSTVLFLAFPSGIYVILATGITILVSQIQTWQVVFFIVTLSMLVLEHQLLYPQLNIDHIEHLEITAMFRLREILVVILAFLFGLIFILCNK